MRTISVVAGLAVMLLSSAVLAEDIAGAYDVKYEEVSNNCASPLKYPNGKIELKLKGTQVTVDIDRTPLMTGSAGKGKISAKSKVGKTMVDGMDGVFSIAGKVTPEGLLAVVMVGEYSAQGKALCTQSWNVTGTKSDKKK
ncbi:MAG: hypothetical protein AB7O24_25965, partial [Kofleriaceae bacterium]